MKVFRMNEYEEWAGESWEQVKEEYLELTGLPEDEAFEEPRERTQEEMKTLTVVDCDGDVTGEEDKVFTFAEWLSILLERGLASDGEPFFFAGYES